VQLSPADRAFVEGLRTAIRRSCGKKRSLEYVIQLIIRDYRQCLDEKRDPDILNAARQLVRQVDLHRVPQPARP
jgi:hypothetical protein